MLSLLVQAMALGATATLTVSQVNAPAQGGAVQIPVTVAVPEGQKIAALQFDLEFDPRALTLPEKGGVLAGAAAKAAGKQVSFSPVADGKAHVLVVGFNQEVIGDGELVLLAFEANRANMHALQPVYLRNALLADPAGLKVPVESQDGGVHLLGAPLAASESGAAGHFGRLAWLLPVPGGLAVLVAAFLWQTKRRQKNPPSRRAQGKIKRNVNAPDKSSKAVS